MRNPRRMRRLASLTERPAGSLSLTSLMDIFTILLLYLLVNQSDSTPLDPPKDIRLPNSIVETKPRESLVVSVSGDQVLVKGEAVVSMADVIASSGDVIEPIRSRMESIRKTSVGEGDEADARNTEVTIMADRGVHYSALKRIMASCTAAGYNKISLAVNQK
ncbi:biopolymer transporter ExbD [Alcanivorax sp.]|uniref:ExbD/TolR family protein n=2 Tax=Alcanivoracaceae TaxID=224372 RepID=UPI00342624D3